MKKISMDEDYIKYFCDGIRKHLEYLIEINEELLDSDADVLDRYLNFMKLNCLIKAIEISTSISRDCLGAGHDINHEFLQTKSAKKLGWDKLDMKCPIFKHDEEDE
jgi:hypothetical protein